MYEHFTKITTPAVCRSALIFITEQRMAEVFLRPNTTTVECLSTWIIVCSVIAKTVLPLVNGVVCCFV